MSRRPDVRVLLATTGLVLALTGCSPESPAAGPSGPESPDEASSETSPADEPGEERPGEESPDGTTIVADGGGLPDGTYRVEFSDQHLAAHGLDPEGVAGNHGVWTHTLADGGWRVEQVAPDVTDLFEGVYEVRGDDLFWRFHDTLQVLHLTWRTDENGDLHFTQVSDTGEHLDFQFALPWVRTD